MMRSLLRVSASLLLSHLCVASSLSSLPMLRLIVRMQADKREERGECNKLGAEDLRARGWVGVLVASPCALSLSSAPRRHIPAQSNQKASKIEKRLARGGKKEWESQLGRDDGGERGGR